ncbi:alpha/beta hydrolase-fold protein [Galbitalea sp. SE-J8]|uniref:alpha/beta hydrolase-fold protein n=1 Tax=Galbitalea sp. SE-J8 TaxID=3054952 RepID=UPI00259CDFDE|nr:alpha/beta hydrolase-fold protein [Galbitalea sp. SE-J8]MDM4761872.1 alpha/beta hydrolase-fold protein [Galbitalea sp. SE-J8]
MTPSRRAFLIAGGGVLGAAALAAAAGEAVDLGILPGRSTMYRTLGLNGPAGVIPDAAAGAAVSGTFSSAARGRDVGWTVAYPPGAEPGADLPVAIWLHGLDGTHETAFRLLGLDRFLAAAVADGTPPFAIATVDGGNGYWHARVSGDDAGRMVVDEFLPLLADRGLRTERAAFGGWSMGGYGALLLAGRLGAAAVTAVAAASPAMWNGWASAPRTAFDGHADYDAHRVQGHQDELDGIAVRIDCGRGDGFSPVISSYVDGFDREIPGDRDAGGHDAGFWRRVAADDIRFIGAALNA